MPDPALTSRNSAEGFVAPVEQSGRQDHQRQQAAGEQHRHQHHRAAPDVEPQAGRGEQLDVASAQPAGREHRRADGQQRAKTTSFCHNACSGPAMAMATKAAARIATQKMLEIRSRAASRLPPQRVAARRSRQAREVPRRRASRLGLVRTRLGDARCDRARSLAARANHWLRTSMACANAAIACFWSP